MAEYKIQLEAFEGPLDLLLKLIEDEELDITKVSLAKVTDQFIQYVNLAEQMRPGEMADFLVVASRLLLIKSKVLLPALQLDEEDEGTLEKQLKIYKEYYEAAKKIRLMLKGENFLFSRLKPIQVFTPKFIAPVGLNGSRLAEIFAKALLRLEPIVNLPQAMIRKTISIREKIMHITEMILHKVTFSFKQLIGAGHDRTEVIVSFLAILELVKQRTLDVEQGELFAEINIKKL
ncbi:MAG: ScpA family protein [Candidatus Komeilibacteria bacterium]|nr:ScpA family protein [Candidatus Komeilibacteria bacterium]